jgi:hypothetical protein
MSTAKLISTRTHLIPGRLRVSELFFDVALDHANHNSKTIRIFARSVERVETPAAPPAQAPDQKPKQLPYLVYLQGGPGFGCAAPQDYGFVGGVLDRGFKVCRMLVFLCCARKGGFFSVLCVGCWRIENYRERGP